MNRNSIGTITEMNPTAGMWHFSLQKLCDNNPRKVSSVSLDNGCDQLFGVVNGQLWIPGTHVDNSIMSIHATDGSHISTLDLSVEIETPRAVTEYQGVTPVAIIASDTGLFEISLDGSINAKIYDGEFSDVCVVGPTVYALEYYRNELHAFHKQNGKWTTEKSISLHDFHADKSYAHCNTLRIVANFIYVYQYPTPETMLKYNMDGMLLGKYGDGNYGADADAGQVWGGRLCGYDNAGSLIVCDNNNKRLQVLNADGKWSITRLNHLGFYPRYAVPMDENTFCILQDGAKVLHFYKME